VCPRKLTHATVQVLIGLDDVEPAVWRRLLLPGDADLGTVHRMFQAALGWSDSHLHSFLIGGRWYGLPDDDGPVDEDPDDDVDDDGEQVDERSITLLEALKGHDRFVYEYDFGDGWTHQVAVEAILPQADRLRFAVCLAGDAACPPEDVGGPEGYRDVLIALADPSHEEHAELMSSIGGAFDPEAFDLGQANIALQKIR
jgi:hypothetical protein